MGRAPCCDKANVKKGPWAPEEDAKLKTFIQTNGTGGNWITLPSKAGLKRCGKSCRLRWINYLRPDIKHGSFTEEEEKLIIEYHAKVGSRWSLIAAQLQGRTDNDIKNYWNTRLKKKLAERVMNPLLTHHHQQPLHRSYQMRSGTGSMFVSLQQDAIRQSIMPKDRLIDHQTAQYLEQHRYNAQLAIQQGRSASLFPQGQHIEQWQQQPQMVAVKNELQLDPERLTRIESELANIINTETMASGQSADGLHLLSPQSPCSNFSSDRSYGGHLDENSYGDNFICNSYGDPPPLVDAQSHSLLPMSSVLSPLSQQRLPSTQSSIITDDSAADISIPSADRFDGLYMNDLGTLSDQSSFLNDVISSPMDRFVKEEFPSDLFTADFTSSSPARGCPSTRGWPTSSLRCGDGLLAANQAQMLSSQMPDSFSEPLRYNFANPKYVST